MRSIVKARITVGTSAVFLFLLYRWMRHRDILQSIREVFSRDRRRRVLPVPPLTSDPWAGASSRVKTGPEQTKDLTSNCQWCFAPRVDTDGAEWKGKWFCNACNVKWEQKKDAKRLRIVRYSPEPTIPQDGEFHWIPNFLPPEEAESTFDAMVSELKLTENGTIDWSCHRKCEEPQQSKTFNDLMHRLTEHFCVKICEARLNYFRDGEDWKPFHRDRLIIHEDRIIYPNDSMCLGT